VGSGPDRDDLLRRLKDMKLVDDTVLTGTIPHEQVLGLYRQAQLFVHGCREAADGARDGIPHVIAEAMAMGVPVAATEYASIPELVIHGETGLLAPPDSPEILARNMAELLSDDGLRRRIIPAARRRVEEIFDNRILAVEIAGLYELHGVPAAWGRG